jgi:hypothetical protein
MNYKGIIFSLLTASLALTSLTSIKSANAIERLDNSAISGRSNPQLNAIAGGAGYAGEAVDSVKLFAKVVKPPSKPPSKPLSRPKTGCQKNVAECVNNATGAAKNINETIQNHRGK